MIRAFFISCIAAAAQGLLLEEAMTSSPYGHLLAQMNVNKNYAGCKVVSDRA